MASDSAFLYTVASLLSVVLNVVFWALVVRTALRVANVSVGAQAAEWLNRLTTPVLAPFQRVVPRVGGVDLAPLAAGVAIQMVQRLILV